MKLTTTYQFGKLFLKTDVNIADNTCHIVNEFT